MKHSAFTQCTPAAGPTHPHESRPFVPALLPSMTRRVVVSFQLSNAVRQLSAELRDTHIYSCCHTR